MIHSLLLVATLSGWGEPITPDQMTRSRQGAVGTADASLFPCVGRVDVSGGSRGSATLVLKDGRRAVAITAYHVIRGSDGRGTISFPAFGERFPFSTLETDKSNDIASLLIDGNPTPMGAYVAENPPTIGDYFVLAGYGGTPRDGFFAAIGRFSKEVRSDHHVQGNGRHILGSNDCPPTGWVSFDGVWSDPFDTANPMEYVPHAQIETVVSQGDSGGGAFCRGKLSGVISMGNAEFAVVAAHRPGLLQRILPNWGCQDGRCGRPSPGNPPQDIGGGSGVAPPAPTPPIQTPTTPERPTQPSGPEDQQPSQGPFVPYPPSGAGEKPKQSPVAPVDWWDLVGKGAIAASAAFGFSFPFWVRGLWRIGTGYRRVKRGRRRRKSRQGQQEVIVPAQSTPQKIVYRDRPVYRDRVEVVATDTPPPPAQVETVNHYVSYPTDKASEANAWASEQIARKYPGAVPLMEMHRSLVGQYLGGAKA